MDFKKKLLSGLSAVVMIVIAQGIFGVWRAENIQQHLLKSHEVSLREGEAATEMLQTVADFKALLAGVGGLDEEQWQARRAAGDSLIAELKQSLARGVSEASV